MHMDPIIPSLGESWINSLYAGALLDQIGEFSFVIAAIGAQTGILQPYGYQLALSTIVMTLLLTVIWVTPVKKWYMHKKDKTGDILGTHMPAS